MRENAERLVHSSFTAPAYPPCITKVDELKQIKIQDLQLETHHRGVYLLLRCITPPSRMTAIMVLVEDKNEDVAMLQMYQQEDAKIRPAAEIANTGTVLLVKKPYYKVMGDGEYGLRVDHLSDVVQLRAQCQNSIRMAGACHRTWAVGRVVEAERKYSNERGQVRGSYYHVSILYQRSVLLTNDPTVTLMRLSKQLQAKKSTFSSATDHSHFSEQSNLMRPYQILDFLTPMIILQKRRCFGRVRLYIISDAMMIAAKYLKNFAAFFHSMP